MRPHFVLEAKDKIRLTRQRLLTAQSIQKSYADKRRRELVFKVGDKVFLRVSPMKGVMRFGKRGKLSPRYIGPYEILDRVGGGVSFSTSSRYIFHTSSVPCFYVEEVSQTHLMYLKYRLYQFMIT